MYLHKNNFIDYSIFNVNDLIVLVRITSVEDHWTVTVLLCTSYIMPFLTFSNFQFWYGLSLTEHNTVEFSLIPQNKWYPNSPAGQDPPGSDFTRHLHPAAHCGVLYPWKPSYSHSWCKKLVFVGKFGVWRLDLYCCFCKSTGLWKGLFVVDLHVKAPLRPMFPTIQWNMSCTAQSREAPLGLIMDGDQFRSINLEIHSSCIQYIVYACVHFQSTLFNDAVPSFSFPSALQAFISVWNYFNMSFVVQYLSVELNASVWKTAGFCSVTMYFVKPAF